jgi:hypothetical protein
LNELPYNAAPSWLAPFLSPTTWVTVAYWASMVTVPIALPALVRASGRPFGLALAFHGAGILLGYWILPLVHEYAHALAYRFVGVRNVQIRYGAGRVRAVCIAPGEVLSRDEFVVVALGPLVGVNTVLAVATVFGPHGAVALGMAGALVVHLWGCGSDVAVLNFMWLHRGNLLFTFDDPVEECGAFYRAKRSIGS